jgi:hypothetical protein
LLHLALVAPELREAHGGAKFKEFGLLLTSDRERVLEVRFRLRCIRLGRQQREFSGHAIDLGLAPPFFSSFLLPPSSRHRCSAKRHRERAAR